MDELEDFDFPEYDEFYRIVDDAFQGKADVPLELVDEIGDITDKAWQGGVNQPPDNSSELEEAREIQRLMTTNFLHYCPEELADLWERYTELYALYMQTFDALVYIQLNETYEQFKEELRSLSLI